MANSFRVSKPASQDLDEIWEYTFEQSYSVDVADRVLRAVYDACEQVALNPQLGHLRQDLTDRELRFWSVYNYLLVYKPGTEPLEVVAVLHGARDVSGILEGR